MSEAISFTVPGIPRQQHRPRFKRIGNFVRTHSDPRDPPAAGNIQHAFMEAVGGEHELWFGPVILEITGFFPRTKSQNNKRYWDDVVDVPHCVAPDLSNIIKLVEDALNGLAWHDDSRIFRIIARKYYCDDEGEMPRVDVTISHRPELVPRNPKKKEKT